MPSIGPLLVSITGVLVSSLIGAMTVWLALRKRIDEVSLGRAERKTTALQLLSDEEFTIEQVRDECVTINTLVELGSFGSRREHLIGEAKRIKSEADAMLTEVRARRRTVERSLSTLSSTELESAISVAYHGKRRAEAQLKRTQLSRTEVLKSFQDGK